jgi:hypothetical protein
MLPMPSGPSDPVNFQTDAERFHLLVDAVTDYAIYMLCRHGRTGMPVPNASRVIRLTK